MKLYGLLRTVSYSDTEILEEKLLYVNSSIDEFCKHLKIEDVDAVKREMEELLVTDRTPLDEFVSVVPRHIELNDGSEDKLEIEYYITKVWFND